MSFTLRPSHRFLAQWAVLRSAGPLLKLPRVCALSFLLLIALLGLSHGSVYAEWVAIEKKYQSPGLQTIYIDSATINQEGQLVTMVTLIDWKWMQGNRTPSRFHSTKITRQFDCANKRLRSLASTDFYGHMATGVPSAGYIDKDRWLSIEPASLDRVLWEMVCGKP